MWTFTWFVHFELPFRLKGTEKIHTEGFLKFPSNIYSILYDPGLSTNKGSILFRNIVLVCLFGSDKRKTSKPIGPNFCEAAYMTHGKEYGQFKLEKICLKKTVYIRSFNKSAILPSKPRKMYVDWKLWKLTTWKQHLKVKMLVEKSRPKCLD